MLYTTDWLNSVAPLELFVATFDLTLDLHFAASRRHIREALFATDGGQEMNEIVFRAYRVIPHSDELKTPMRIFDVSKGMLLNGKWTLPGVEPRMSMRVEINCPRLS